MEPLPPPRVTLRPTRDRRQLTDSQRIEAIQLARADFLRALRLYQQHKAVMEAEKARLNELVEEAE